MPNWLVIGAGATLKHHIGDILKLVKYKELITIGVNNIAHLYVPDYLLFTNYKRFVEFKQNIAFKKKLLIGSSLFNKNKVDKYFKDYEIVQDNINIYRTSGCLAIQYAHDKGARKIYVAGMDGYTLKYKGDQHCYGSGNTDSSNNEYEAKKDFDISRCLDNLKKQHVNFSIITPTVYQEHYEANVI